MAEAKKAAPKRKTTARKTTARKAPARKTAAKTTARKTAAARKPDLQTTARRAIKDVEKTAKQYERKAEKLQDKLTLRAREASRNAFLASLGFYGVAFDQAREQFDTMQNRIESRRKNADKLYTKLVKRGSKVEKQLKSAIDEMELSRLELDSLTDRAKLEARLEKARARFSELRESVGFRSAA